MEYYMLHKPRGCVTANRDKAAQTVMDVFPPEKRAYLHPVGRLDRDTTGLLLITNDGKLVHLLTNPKFRVKKSYRFTIIGKLTPEKIRQLEEKIALFGNEKPTAGCEVSDVSFSTVAAIADALPQSRRDRYLKNPEGAVSTGIITVTEGKKHEVKLMMRAVGCRVVTLTRVMHGGLYLDANLQPGQYRPLTENEIGILKSNG